MIQAIKNFVYPPPSDEERYVSARFPKGTCLRQTKVLRDMAARLDDLEKYAHFPCYGVHKK